MDQKRYTLDETELLREQGYKFVLVTTMIDPEPMYAIANESDDPKITEEFDRN